MNTDLIDTFALASMAELINAYAPEKLSNEDGEVEKWCEFIARTSYYMAETMMDTRSTFHDIVVKAATEEGDNA